MLEIVDKSDVKARNEVYHNETNTCDRCGINFDISSDSPRRECDKEGNWTGRWNCKDCWQKYDPNSEYNIRKSLRDHRTGNLDPYSPTGKGDRFQKLSCKFWNAKDLNIENDNYRSPLDHWCPELGYFQTQGRFYNQVENGWASFDMRRDHNKEFNFIVCYCADKNGENIERMYIFPKEVIKNRKSITIKRYDSKGRLYKKGWYEQYRIKDEGTIKKINEIWKTI